MYVLDVMLDCVKHFFMHHGMLLYYLFIYTVCTLLFIFPVSDKLQFSVILLIQILGYFYFCKFLTSAC